MNTFSLCELDHTARLVVKLKSELYIGQILKFNRLFWESSFSLGIRILSSLYFGVLNEPIQLLYFKYPYLSGFHRKNRSNFLIQNVWIPKFTKTAPSQVSGLINQKYRFKATINWSKDALCIAIISDELFEIIYLQWLCGNILSSKFPFKRRLISGTGSRVTVKRAPGKAPVEWNRVEWIQMDPLESAMESPKWSPK